MVEDREFEDTTEEQYYKGLADYLAELKTLECDTCGYTIQTLEKDIWHERCPNCAEMGTWKDRKESNESNHSMVQ